MIPLGEAGTELGGVFHLGALVRRFRRSRRGASGAPGAFEVKELFLQHERGGNCLLRPSPSGFEQGSNPDGIGTETPENSENPWLGDGLARMRKRFWVRIFSPGQAKNVLKYAGVRYHGGSLEPSTGMCRKLPSEGGNARSGESVRSGFTLSGCSLATLVSPGRIQN